jgi:hypothetical protein
VSPAEEPAARGRRSWVLPSVLAVLLVALVATCVVLLLDRRASLPVEQAVEPAAAGSALDGSTPAEQAVARARLAARTYFTLAHPTVEEDMDRLRALGTDAFVEEYDRMARPLARRVVEEELRLSAALPANGVATEYLSQNVAQLLVSVDVTTRRGDGPGSTADYRTRVQLQRVEGDWLVAGMDEVR